MLLQPSEEEVAESSVKKKKKKISRVNSAMQKKSRQNDGKIWDHISEVESMKMLTRDIVSVY
jgi:hypothetical protein